MRSLVVAAAVAAVALPSPAAAGPTRYPVVRRPVRAGCTLPDARPPPAQRTFVSPAVDAAIDALLPRFKDPNLGRLFANSLPNALDTTVYRHTGPDDTFIVTGDIDAMWLRDSTNQVLPYLRFVGSDPALRDLIVGLIARQARSVLLDPYANAFQLDDLHGQGPHADEDSSYRTAFAGTTVSAYTPSIFERKWEVDSLANVLQLSFAYWNATGDTAPFANATWLGAVATILQTYADQQADTEQEDAAGGPAYTFQRTATNPTDTLQQGRGMPVKYTGLIKSAFRGSDGERARAREHGVGGGGVGWLRQVATFKWSHCAVLPLTLECPPAPSPPVSPTDPALTSADATTFSYSVPENAFASVQLRNAAVMLRALGQAGLATQADAIASTVEAGLAAHAIINHSVAGRVWAFELVRGKPICAGSRQGSGVVNVETCVRVALGGGGGVLTSYKCRYTFFPITPPPPITCRTASATRSSWTTPTSRRCWRCRTTVRALTHPGAERVTHADACGYSQHAPAHTAPIRPAHPPTRAGFANASDPLYLATRAGVLSGASNPFYFNGTAGAGIGGPHNGPYVRSRRDGWRGARPCVLRLAPTIAQLYRCPFPLVQFVWPMALIAQAWTAQSDAEIESCVREACGRAAAWRRGAIASTRASPELHAASFSLTAFSTTPPCFLGACSLLTTLVGASACTGLTHESFDKNSFFSYTRPWCVRTPAVAARAGLTQGSQRDCGAAAHRACSTLLHRRVRP
jgi:meiotically up-regulated gene 157 (Mug157) protein